MALRDLFTANAALLRDQEFGFGEQVTYFDPSTTPATETTLTGIFEILGDDPLVQLQHGDEVIEQATLELPANVSIDMKGWFVINGETWKIAGRGGRDANLQTITLNHPIPISKRIAKRRG